MSPWYRRIEKSAGVALLTEQQRREGYYFKFFSQALLRGAAKDRSEFYRTMIANGVMSANECRELEDLNPYPGGDVYTRQINMGAIGADGTTQDAQAPEAPQPPPDGEPQEPTQ
jgi:phage portal protein BeeE